VGSRARRRLESLLTYAGANLVPAPPPRTRVVAFADRALSQGRRVAHRGRGGPRPRSALWGAAAAALGDGQGDSARCCAAHGHLGAAAGAAGSAGRRVRQTRSTSCGRPGGHVHRGVSSISRTIGEGAHPTGTTDESSSRTAGLRQDEGGEVIFKAGDGASTRSVCQVQGVGCGPRSPAARGGLAAPACRVVSRRAADRPMVSLYVTTSNAPARVPTEGGFTRTGQMMSVLL